MKFNLMQGDCQPHKSGDLLGGQMDAEKAFWQYWEKRWPFTSRNEKVLSLSANFRSTKEAFLAGWEAKGKAQQLLESANENKTEI